MNKKKWLVLVIGVIALVALDQFTKYLATAYLMGQADIPLIKGVFELSYVENRGAAFGILQNRREFFLLMTAAAMIGLGWLYHRVPFQKRFYPILGILIALVAGAIGNLIDRSLNGFVVDFLYFKLINFPVFNVADIYVTVSSFLAIALILFVYRENELDEIFPSKKGEQ